MDFGRALFRRPMFGHTVHHHTDGAELSSLLPETALERSCYLSSVSSQAKRTYKLTELIEKS